MNKLFCILAASVSAIRVLDQQEEVRPMELWKKCDKNGNGTITVNEAVSCMTAAGIKAKNGDFDLKKAL